ncbi:MAG: putative zinc-binding metallopeptidase [Bdellovibrionales bacterium]|nr:putative zinc-binding metallopeptidase [Bdellovibrionales bacterium]
MKNKMSAKFIPLIALLLLSSCSRYPRYANGELRKLDRKIDASNEKPDRIIAAENSVEHCAMDDINEEKLLVDIRSLENNKLPQSKSILSGLDLSKFSPSQANFLERSKDWIFSEDQNFSGCMDVRCVYERIYSGGSGLEGYLHYYFFLKMGYVLSSVAVNPVETDLSTYTYKDVLFSLEELKNFYYLTKALPPSFQKMIPLSSIHRMPRNKKLTKYPSACGVAGGQPDKGYVVLLDACLTREQNSMFAGNFFPLITHEFSHRLDYTLLANHQIFSETQPWLTLSGWSTYEAIDKDGKAVLTWKRSQAEANAPASDGFVRDYAATSPTEDFADTIGYGRFDSEKVSQVSPRKYSWIVKNVFGGKNYTISGLTPIYTELLSEFVLKDLPSIINTCVENKNSFAFQMSEAVALTYKEYDPELIECIFGGADRSISLGIKNLKIAEPEACSFFQNSEIAMKAKVLEKINELIKKDLNQNIEIGKQLLVLAEFGKRLNDDLDPREIFIKCQDPSQVPLRVASSTKRTSVDCYNTEINFEFSKIAEDYKDQIPNQLETYETSYLAENSYISVKDKISTLFSQIFTGTELKFRETAKSKWKNCLEASPEEHAKFDSLNLALTPFNGGAQYIRKSLLNCLNESAENELYEVLEKTSKRLGLSVSSPSTKRFVLDMYLIHFTSTLQDLVVMGKNAEATKINEKKNSTTQKVTASLVNDTSWIGLEAKSDREIYNTCQDKTKIEIEEELDKENAEEYNFHSPSNLWNESICSSILANSKVKSLIDSNNTKAVKKALVVLNALFLDEATDTMVKCKKQFTKNNAIVNASRNLCLTNPITWNSLIEDALARWKKEQNIEFIELAQKMGSDQLSTNKTTLKDQAIKKMNAIKL